MKTLYSVFSVIIISIFLSACSAEAPYYKEYDLNRIWVLDNLGGASITTSNFPNGAPWMELKVGKSEMGGNTGCNGMGGTVYASSEMIIFSNIIATKMFCENVDETRFLSALDNTGYWTIENERLFLFDAPGGVVLAVFKEGTVPETETQN